MNDERSRMPTCVVIRPAARCLPRNRVTSFLTSAASRLLLGRPPRGPPPDSEDPCLTDCGKEDASMRRFVFVLSLLFFLPFAFSAPALAAKPVTTLSFDEVPFQPVDGLDVSGVTFGFQIGGVPSTDAHYNAFGPGTTTFVQDPSLEGNAAGVLTLDVRPADNGARVRSRAELHLHIDPRRLGRVVQARGCGPLARGHQPDDEPDGLVLRSPVQLLRTGYPDGGHQLPVSRPRYPFRSRQPELPSGRGLACGQTLTETCARWAWPRPGPTRATDGGARAVGPPRPAARRMSPRPHGAASEFVPVEPQAIHGHRVWFCKRSGLGVASSRLPRRAALKDPV